MESWLMAVDCGGRHAGRWSYIHGSTRNYGNEGNTNNVGCVPYSVYVVLCVNSWSWHGEIDSNDLTLCSAMMVELWTRKGEMGDEDENDVEDYERIWEIRGTTCLIGFRRPRIGVITRWIGTHTCSIEDGKSTGTRNSLKSQFLKMISPIPSHLSLSCPQLNCHLRTRSEVIALYLSMPWWWVNTEYRIHWVQHTPSTPYSAYCIIPRSTVSHSQPVSQLLADHVVLDSLHSDNSECTNESSLSSRRASLPNYHLQIDRLLVLPQSLSIMASKCISKLAQSQPPSVSLNSHDDGLQEHLQTRLTMVSKLAQSRTPGVSPNSLHYGLGVHLQTCLVTVSNLAWSQPQSLFPHQQNVKWFGSHYWTTQQLWTATLILPDAPRCSQMLPDCLNAKQCALRCSETTWPVLLNGLDVVEHTARISWRMYSCLLNAAKSRY